VTGGRRFAPLCFAVLVVVSMAVLMAACGSGSTGTSATTAAGDLETYTDPDYGYSLSYPADWEVQTGTSDVTAGSSAAGTVGFYDPEGTKVGDTFVDLAMVMVYKLTMTVDDPWDSAIKTELEGVLTSLESQATGMKVEESLKETTVSGLKGYSTTYTFDKDGTPMRSTLYFLFDGNMEYELTEQATTATWEASKPALDAIVASFKPGATGR
jgi:hypothetical protein